MPAPQGNNNATTHGVFSTKRYTIPSIGKPFSQAKIAANNFRRQVEEAASQHGQLGVYEASMIRTATISFRHTYVCGIVLARAGEPGEGKLNHAEYLNWMDRMAKFAAATDAALKCLKLDVVEEQIDVPGIFNPNGTESREVIRA